MPPLKELLLAPLYRDVDDYDCRLLELDREVTCGDVLAAVARELGLRRGDLALVGSKAGCPTRFHAREAPVAFMQVKGVQSLADLPTPMKVKPKKRSELSLEQALKIQEELIDAYSSEVFILMMLEAKQQCKQKWKVDDSINTRDYSEKMKAPMEMAQEMVLPKWGYEATARGMLFMQSHFAPWDPLPQIQHNIDIINKKIGFDYAWVGQGDDDDDNDAAVGGTNFGKDGKLKLLYLYGGGVNSAVAKMQVTNMFKDSPMYANMDVEVFEAPHEASLKWHMNPLMQQQLRPFGETIYLYFDRVPYSNSQCECYEGIEYTIKALKDHFRRKGPYDGVVGFDMGGEVLLQAARLQQEGDPGFKGMFRFMLLFTSATARRLGNCKRPQAPLRIPALISWSNSDENHPYTMYQETALFFAPEVREVVLHDFGHIPPRWSRAAHAPALERLTRLLDAMWRGQEWRPSAHPDNAWAEELALPVPRQQPRAARGGAGPRRLLVVHDPMGAHRHEAVALALEEGVSQGRFPAPVDTCPFVSQGVADAAGSRRADLAVSTMAAEGFRAKARQGMSVEAVEYTPEQASHDWHVRDADVLNGQMKREDIILDDEHDAYADSVARGLLSGAKLDAGDRVGVVGLGTGAFVAFALARILAAEERASLIGLWLVDPPTCLPTRTTKQPGSLATCPVSVLMHQTSIVGPPWCYETATRGPFEHSTFERPAEMINIVVDEFSSFCDVAEQRAEEEEREGRAAREAEERRRREAEEARLEAERAARLAEEERARREAERAAEAERRAEAEARARRQAEAAEESRRREAEAAGAERAARGAALEARRRAAAEAGPSASQGAAPSRERCRAEFDKGPRSWAPVAMEQLQANHEKAAPGMFYGLEFPWSAATLEKMGASWLTKAFRAAGTLAPDNFVTKLNDVKEFVGGGACSKLVFEVEYERASEDLHTRLFAKIPFPLSGKTLSDRMSSSIVQQGMDFGEINTYRLLESQLPMRTPKYYFGDISNETTNFILITERVPFGGREGGHEVEPAYDKMKDWELRGPMDEYYYLLVRLGAQVAGLYKAEALASFDKIHMFYDPGLREPHLWGVRPESSGTGDAEFKAKLRMGTDFVQTTAKVLFPAACSTAEFLGTWRRTLLTANAYAAEIAWWSNRDPDYVAWCHGNLNVDNAWWWRDEDGGLFAGVLDWGGAGCSSLGNKLWWWLYCCEHDFLSAELPGLLRCFAEEYHVHGGPLLDEEELRWQFVLAALNQGAVLLGTVPQIYRMCPKKQWPTIESRKDPRIAGNVDGKNTLRIYVGLFVSICRILAEWDVVERFDAWVGEVTSAAGMPRKAVPDA